MSDNVIFLHEYRTKKTPKDEVSLETSDYERRKEIDKKRRDADNARIRNELKRGTHPGKRW